MIGSYRRAADAQDLQEMTQDKGSLGRSGVTRESDEAQ